MPVVMKSIFSSLVGPCGSESSGWWQTFSFLCQSSGKGSYTGDSSAWPTSTDIEEETWTISGCVGCIPFRRHSHTANEAEPQCIINTDHQSVRLYASLDALGLQSFQSWSVEHSAHQLRRCVQVAGQVKWLHWGETEKHSLKLFNFSGHLITLKAHKDKDIRSQPK